MNDNDSKDTYMNDTLYNVYGSGRIGLLNSCTTPQYKE